MAIKTVRFAGSAVTVEYEGGRPAEIVEFLFGAVPESPQNTRPPLAACRVGAGMEPGSLSLHLSRTPVYEGTDEGRLAELLLSAVCHELADRSRGGLLFHAGALEWKGRAVLLAGGIGAGKTTLSLWLATRGLFYLTDEMVFLDGRESNLRPFVRPLNLKRPSREPLRTSFDFETHGGRMLSTPAFDLIPPDILGSRSTGGPLAPGLFLFPRYVKGGEAVFESLSKAQAGLELMKCLVNARNLPDHGFRAATRLGGAAPAYRLSYGSFDQIADRMDAILESL